MNNPFASPLELLGGVLVKELIMPTAHALLAFAILTAPTAATANAHVPQSIAVGIGDLDLSSDKGQRILALRIQRAARTLCKTDALASLPQHIRAQRKCIREARASAETAARARATASDPASGGGG